MRRTAIQIGEIFERLTVIDEATPKINGKGFKIYRVKVRCACGNETVVYESKLRYGSTRSCGCLGVESSLANLPKGHGHARHGKLTPTYISWRSMIGRCTEPRCNGYKNYGGRGITICERWKSFENFLIDMGERPKGKTLDRKDPSGNYEPENCIWSTWKAQEQNRRNNVLVMLDGHQFCLSEAIRRSGISHHRLRYYRATRKVG